MGSVIVLQGKIRINRPLEEVFQWVADYTKDPVWRSEVKEMKYTTPAPIGVGSQCVEVSRVLGRRLETWTEVTEFIPNDRIVSRSFQAQTPVVIHRKVQGADGGAEFEYRLDVDLGPVLLYRLFKPLVRIAGQKSIDRYMRKLKQVLEEGQPDNTVNL